MAKEVKLNTEEGGDNIHLPFSAKHYGLSAEGQLVTNIGSMNLTVLLKRSETIFDVITGLPLAKGVYSSVELGPSESYYVQLNTVVDTVYPENQKP